MSVIVRGMEMPESCDECRMLTDAGFCSAKPKDFCGYASDFFLIRPDWCPLIEIPDKHGRLIDADAFAERIETIIEQKGYDDMSLSNFTTVKDVLEAVICDLKGTTIYGYMNTPTVIKAEGMEE